MNFSDYWDRLIQFLTTYDVATLSELVQQLDWKLIVRTPLFWLISVPIMCWIVWKRHFRLLLLLASAVSFLALVQVTLPPTGGSIPLDRLLTFVGGCVVLIGLNFYFLFIRGD